MQRTDPTDRPDDLCVVLSDGRRVALTVYGDPDGVPAVYLHGCPGSRLEPPVFALDEHARSNGVRLVAPDRPGIGGSDQDRARSVHSYAADLGELLDRLGLARSALVAFGDAAPYALSAAAQLGDRIATTALVSCTDSALPSAESAAHTSAPEQVDRLGVVRRVRWMSSWLLASTAPGAFARQLYAALPEIDSEVLDAASVRPQLSRSLREAFRGGWYGPALDQLLATSASGVGLELVRDRVALWQGTLDPSGIAPALALRDRIVRSEAHLLPEGRASLLRHHGSEILADVARACRTNGGSQGFPAFTTADAEVNKYLGRVRGCFPQVEARSRLRGGDGDVQPRVCEAEPRQRVP